jgi:hypothetical protein
VDADRIDNHARGGQHAQPTERDDWLAAALLA